MGLDWARMSVAVSAGRAVRALVRFIDPDRGSNVPGRVALGIDPRALHKLSNHLSHPIILVSGTNGKTTTTSLVTELLSVVAGEIATNKAGANLASGLVAALLDKKSSPGVFEVDEGALPAVLSEVHPDIVVLLNLTRDQLDRYGEIDTVASRWLASLKSVAEKNSRGLTIVANTDDPRIAYIGSELARTGHRVRVVNFGVETVSRAEELDVPSADSSACPACGADLSYEAAYLTGGGRYSCKACRFSRPPAHYVGSRYDSLGMRGSQIFLESPSGALKVAFPLPGLHNVYNALAATAAAAEAGLSTEVIEATLARTTAAYGRSEPVVVDGKAAFLLLSKNPQSLSQNLHLIRQEAEAFGWKHEDARRLPVVFALNDRVADGTDVSWIWDVDFAGSLGYEFFFVVSGDRAESAALRLVYDGWDPDRVLTVRDPYHALCLALSNAPKAPNKGWTVPCLATYTAMRTLRSQLVKRSMAPPIEKGQS